jgi:hypothetical protein
MRDASVTPAGAYDAPPRIVIAVSDSPELRRRVGDVGIAGAAPRNRAVSAVTGGVIGRGRTLGGATGVTVGGMTRGAEVTVGSAGATSVRIRGAGCGAGITGASFRGVAGGGRSGTTNGAAAGSRSMSDHGATERMDTNATANNAAVTAAATPNEGQRGP